MSGTEKRSILLIVASLASFLVPYTVSSLTATLPAIIVTSEEPVSGNCSHRD